MTESVSREQHISDGDHQVRELFAQFGKSMYLAANLEMSQVSALTFLQTAQSGKGTQSLFDRNLADNTGHTMGLILKRLRPLIDSPVLVQQLEEALAERNRFAHNFFVDHVLDFVSPQGCELMLAETLAAQSLFIAADRELSLFLQTGLESFGVTPAQHRANVAEETAALWEKAKSLHPSE